jgi:hypothetical protein
MRSPIPKQRAEEIVAGVEVDLDDATVCEACLSFVSFALERGDPKEVNRQLRIMTPDIWADGLSESAIDWVHVACARGVRGADAARAELTLRGGRSAVARAIVRKLAEEQLRRARLNRSLLERLPDDAPSTPEWN